MIEKQTKDNTKHVNIKMPIDLYEEIHEMAINADRKDSQQIRYMLSEYIKFKKSN